VPPLTDRAVVQARLETDRPWSAFSLADLEPVHEPHAHWHGYDGGAAIVLVYAAFTPPILFCHGPLDELDRLLAEPDVAARSPQAWLNITPAQQSIARKHFATFDARAMVRMLFDPACGQDLRDVPEARLQRLTATHVDELVALYADEAPAFFRPRQVDEGVYWGAWVDGRLVSVAGTHVMSAQYAVGAIGNVHTAPAFRGRGLAALVTAAVVRDLREAGASTVVLNIVATNVAARRVYERIGFREYCVYHEGLAAR
jgi:GNAT superfamily N-acetyltransferase